MDALTLADFLQMEATRFLLVLTRVAGIFSFGPLISSNSLPNNFRVVTALAIALLISTSVPDPLIEARTMIDLVVMMVGELSIGLILGGFLQMMFQALQLAGQVAGTQFGLALARLVNPQFDDQVSTTGLVYLTIASLIFLVTGGHREMFAALLETFAVLPLGGVVLDESIAGLALVLLHRSMIFAARVAAPATVAMVLTEIAMGFVGRTVPQLNILSVGFSLRIIVGVTITMASLPTVGLVFHDQLGEALRIAYEALANLAPQP